MALFLTFCRILLIRSAGVGSNPIIPHPHAPQGVNPPPVKDTSDRMPPLRRRRYTKRITKATKDTAPKEAPIATAVACFFEWFVVELPRELLDICVDKGFGPEDVTAGKILAAAVIAKHRNRAMVIQSPEIFIGKKAK